MPLTPIPASYPPPTLKHVAFSGYCCFFFWDVSDVAAAAASWSFLVIFFLPRAQRYVGSRPIRSRTEPSTAVDISRMVVVGVTKEKEENKQQLCRSNVHVFVPAAETDRHRQTGVGERSVPTPFTAQRPPDLPSTTSPTV